MQNSVIKAGFFISSRIIGLSEVFEKSANSNGDGSARDESVVLNVSPPEPSPFTDVIVSFEGGKNRPEGHKNGEIKPSPRKFIPSFQENQEED